MYYVYILKCADNTLYTGITTNTVRRLKEHNSSSLGAKYTKARRPVKLVYSKIFLDKSSALKEEFKIKRMKRLDKVKLFKK